MAHYATLEDALSVNFLAFVKALIKKSFIPFNQLRHREPVKIAKKPSSFFLPHSSTLCIK